MADRKEYMKEWQLKNKEKLKQYHKQWNIDNKEYRKQYCVNNKEHIKQQKKQYYQKNKEDKKRYMKQYNKKYRISHKEYYKQISKRYYIDNKKHINQHQKQYYKENKENRNQYQKQKRRTDLKYNLNNRMSCVIRASLKGNKAGRDWVDLVGYTVKDLEEHLQKKMPPHYTWQDYLDGKLHIDHIIAKKYFNYTKYTHIDFKRCWSLKNLQLLPAEENLIKGAKLEQPFQPSLKMAI